MVDLFSNLLDYVNRTAPAVGLIALIFVLARPNRQVRVLLYTLTFILLRDALTPSSLWSLGIAGGVPWIRFYPSHLFLIGMGVSSLLFTVLLVVGDRENSQDVVFLRKGDSLRGWIASVVGLVVVLTPILIASHRIGIEERGGAVDPNLLGSILVFALSGNLLEELLFRGYVYNLLKRRDADLKAGVMSGFIFALPGARVRDSGGVRSSQRGRDAVRKVRSKRYRRHLDRREHALVSFVEEQESAHHAHHHRRGQHEKAHQKGVVGFEIKARSRPEPRAEPRHAEAKTDRQDQRSSYDPREERVPAHVLQVRGNDGAINARSAHHEAIPLAYVPAARVTKR